MEKPEEENKQIAIFHDDYMTNCFYWCPDPVSEAGRMSIAQSAGCDRVQHVIRRETESL